MLTSVETCVDLKTLDRVGDGRPADLAFLRAAQMVAYQGGDVIVPPGYYPLTEPALFRNLSGEDNAIDIRIHLAIGAEIVVARDSDGIVFDGSRARIGTGHNTKTGVFGGKIWAGSNTAWTTGTLVKFVNTDGATVQNSELRGGARGIHYQGCWGALQRDVFLVHTHSAVCISHGTIKLSIEGVGGIYDCDVDAIVSWGEDAWGNGNLDCTIKNQYLETITGNVINQSGARDHDWTIGPSNTFNDNGGNGAVQIAIAGWGTKVVHNSFKAPRQGSGAGIVLGTTSSLAVVHGNTCRGGLHYSNGWIRANSAGNVITDNPHDGQGVKIVAVPGNTVDD